MLVLRMLEPPVPPNASWREKYGLVSRDAVAVNESFAPGITARPGDNEWIASEGGGVTTILTVVLAALPTLSEAVTMSGCVPSSLCTGVQENAPFPLRLLLDAVDVPKGSDNMYRLGEKPDGVMVNETVVPTGISPVGESD